VSRNDSRHHWLRDATTTDDFLLGWFYRHYSNLSGIGRRVSERARAFPMVGRTDIGNPRAAPVVGRTDLRHWMHFLWWAEVIRAIPPISYGGQS